MDSCQHKPTTLDESLLKLRQNRMGTHRLPKLLMQLQAALPAASDKVFQICKVLVEASNYQSAFLQHRGLVLLLLWVELQLFCKDKCMDLVMNLYLSTSKSCVLNRKRFVSRGGIIVLSYLRLTTRGSLNFWSSNRGKALHSLNMLMRSYTSNELQLCRKAIRRAQKQSQASLSDKRIVKQLNLEAKSDLTSKPPSSVAELLNLCGSECMSMILEGIDKSLEERRDGAHNDLI